MRGCRWAEAATMLIRTQLLPWNPLGTRLLSLTYGTATSWLGFGSRLRHTIAQFTPDWMVARAHSLTRQRNRYEEQGSVHAKGEQAT